jgi:prepilin-type N-terminal cleavage/methylation domain-containing protein
MSLPRAGSAGFSLPGQSPLLRNVRRRAPARQAEACAPSARHRHRRAMTLIETLIAIVVVALVLPVAISGVSHAVQSAEQVRRMDTARRLAETRLARLAADGTWQSTATSGDFDPRLDGEDAAGFHWQLATATWRDPVVRSLALTVSWGPSASPRAVTVTTLVTPLSTATLSEPTSEAAP